MDLGERDEDREDEHVERGPRVEDFADDEELPLRARGERREPERREREQVEQRHGERVEEVERLRQSQRRASEHVVWVFVRHTGHRFFIRIEALRHTDTGQATTRSLAKVKQTKKKSKSKSKINDKKNKHTQTRTRAAARKRSARVDAPRSRSEGYFL